MISRRMLPGMAAAILAAMPSVALSVEAEAANEPRGPEPARPYQRPSRSRYMPHQGKRERERAARRAAKLDGETP